MSSVLNKLGAHEGEMASLWDEEEEESGPAGHWTHRNTAVALAGNHGGMPRAGSLCTHQQLLWSVGGARHRGVGDQGSQSPQCGLLFRHRVEVNYQ